MEFSYGKDVSQDFVTNKLNYNSKYFIKQAKKFAKISNYKQKECFLCGDKRSKKVSTFFGINYLQCRKCTHVYVDKRLSEKALSKYYVEDEEYATSDYADKKLLKTRENLFIPKIKYIKKYATGKNWLDVGSADGTAVVAIKKEGFNVKGLEISKTSREFAKKVRNLDLYPKSLKEFVDENSMDWNVVSFFGVLEHLSDPMKALQLSNKILAKEGLVIIEVPNYNSVSTYVQKLEGLTDRHLSPYAHIMMFTKQSAEYCLKKSGFKPIAVWFWGMDVIELIKYIKKIDKKFNGSELYDVLIRKVNDIQRIFDKDEMGDFFLMIGKK